MYKEKVRGLLCTVPEIKENENQRLDLLNLIDDTGYLYNRITEVYDHLDAKELLDKREGIIEYLEGFKLEERHLRMYCDEKGFNISIQDNGEIIENLEYYFYSSDNKNYEELKPKHICQLDNTKSFDNQSEEVFEKLFNFLSK